MRPPELTQPYEPNPLLRAAYERFFSRIRVDETWVADTGRFAAEGTLVHVLGELNFVDFLALDHLTKRYGLPPIRFVNDLGLWILNPAMGRGWADWVFPTSRSAQLRHAISEGGSAVIFLQRSKGMVDLATGEARRRASAEGVELVRTLIELQQERERPILLIPQVFVWTKRANPQPETPLATLLEPRQWPNAAMTAAQFLYNYRHVALKVGEPLNIQELLTNSADPKGLEVSGDLLQGATYTLLRRLERERRSVTGPANKPADRVRLEIVRSPKLRATIEDLAGERTEDRKVLTGQALAMLRELQARPDTGVRKGLEVVFHRVFQRVYSGIEYDPADFERIRRASRVATLVLLPSHKSHFDYFSLGYVFNDQNLPMPMIAAGDNLNFFPLGALLRRAGAFFIRRSFGGDRLYASVVDAYVRRLIREGHGIELFLEGARSRTGKLFPPKLGMLNLIVDAALNVEQRTVFVPISIGYERIAELQAYERELRGEDKQKEDASQLLKTPAVLRHRYGRLNFQVGQILSLEEIRAELGLPTEGPLIPAKRRAVVTRLGNRVMDEINRVTAVTPGSLTALALLNGPPRQPISHRELYERCNRLLFVLRSLGARVTPATATSGGPFRPEALREALQMFIDAELVSIEYSHIEDWPKRWWGKHRASELAAYAVPESKRLALDVTKNMIVHFLVERSLVSTAMLMPPAGPVPLETVRDRVHKLSRLFKHEFRFRASASFEEIFQQTVETMLAAGELAQADSSLDGGPGAHGWTGLKWIVTFANVLRPYLEGYRVAARSLTTLLKNPLTEKDLVGRALNIGVRMLAAGHITRRECISKPLLENGVQALIGQEYLQRTGGKLQLTESFRSAKGVSAIEGRIAGFLEEV